LLFGTQQWKLLVAVAEIALIYAPTSKDFIRKNKLGSVATIFKSIDFLSQKR
jgi:hypothetical protein